MPFYVWPTERLSKPHPVFWKGLAFQDPFLSPWRPTLKSCWDPPSLRNRHHLFMGPKIEVCHFFTAHLYMISELLRSEVATNMSTGLQLHPWQKAADKFSSPPTPPVKLWNNITSSHQKINNSLTQQRRLDLCIFHLFFTERLYWDIYLWRSECFNWFIKQITLIFSVDFISSHNANSLEITVTSFLLIWLLQTHQLYRCFLATK